MQNFWHEHKHFIKGFAVTLAITLVVGIFGDQTSNFMASVLDLEKPAPFDGTSLPIKKVPDWANLSGSQSSLLASQLPLEKIIDIPNYDPVIFGATVADLSWSIDADQINQLITYAVPYMGSYESSSKEYEGSHLAVDIKVPTGTSVYAVANGKVTKASYSSGFGNHIVIEHLDVPALDENETVTLYSAYAHLSTMDVTVGQIVTRGEFIGESGNTGTSTTPHLHFQIDNENAPWHPWWPFSSAEAAAAGLNFFDGVSAGLNQETAINNTIHPMLWVQRYLVADTADIPSDMHASETTTTEDSTNDTETNTEEPVATETVADTSETVQTPTEENSETNSSENSNESDSGSDTNNQESKTDTQTTEPELETESEPVEVVAIFTDVDSTHDYAKAIQYLKENSIVDGYDDGSFKPERTVNRIEALKMLILGLDINIQPVLDLGFPDTSNQQWYSDFVGTAMNLGVVAGYPDGTFRPGNTINRAEYLKVLLGIAGIAPDSVSEDPYADVPADAWFSPFVAYSKTKNIFPLVGNSFEGAEGVTRAEVAETLYRLIVLRETSVASYSEDLAI